MSGVANSFVVVRANVHKKLSDGDETIRLEEYSFGPQCRPPNHYFVWHGDLNCWTTKEGEPMGGIKELDRYLFWPKYEEKAATRGKLGAQLSDAIPQADVKRFMAEIRPHHRILNGMQLGSKVDLEIERICHKLKGGMVTPESFLNKFFGHAMAQKDGQWWVDMRREAHPFTLMILNYFCMNGLRPEWGQVPVGIKQLRRCTGFDVVCIDRQGRKYGFEIKTGFLHNFDRFAGFMRFPYQNIPDSPRNQAQIQLMQTTKFYEHTFGHGLASATVLLVNSKGVTAFDPDPKIWQKWPAVYARMEKCTGMYTKVIREKTAAKKRRMLNRKPLLRPPSLKGRPRPQSRDQEEGDAQKKTTKRPRKGKLKELM